MARTVRTGKLTALTVTKAKTPGLIGDGGGLYLRVQRDGTKSWAFRFKLGRPREMGLGSLNTYSLAEAREVARVCRQLVNDGKDPIEARRDRIAAAKLAQATIQTFKGCAERYIEAHKDAWKSAKHAYQWEATLRQYVYPAIGALPVGRITTGNVLSVLEPLWKTKPETAGRIRGRIERVLDWARVRGYREGDNVARWKGFLEFQLPRLSDVRAVQHHRAIPYADMGAFMRDLRKQTGTAPIALELTILTAVRTNETLGADWSEIDFKRRLWIIPAERMKGRKGQSREHRIPLSDQALALLKRMAEASNSGFIFPGAKDGASLSNMAMLEVLRRMGRKFVVHGFRSAFSSWARETTATPRDVVEMALAHTIKSKAEASYFHGDLLEKRRALMQLWADHCDREPAEEGANVVPITAAHA